LSERFDRSLTFGKVTFTYLPVYLDKQLVTSDDHSTP